ncbi:MAG: hypothetical protein AAF514_09650 [Verrucomicrobiota bacterium]
MKPSEEQWNRLVDGELKPAEKSELEAAFSPEEREEARLAGLIQQDLKSLFPTEAEPPSPDFFNHRVQRAIDEASLPTASRAPATSGSSWLLEWLHPGRLLPLAGALVLGACLVKFGVIGDGREAGSQVLFAYTPDESVVASSDYFGGEVNATVIRLEGVEPLDSMELIEGASTAEHRPQQSLENEPTHEDRFYFTVLQRMPLTTL